MYRPNAQKLIELREQRRLSVLAAGAAIGIDHRMILRWERGEAKDFSLNKFRKLAEFYGFHGRDIMDLLLDHTHTPPTPIADPSNAPSTTPDAFLQLVRLTLSEDQRQILRGRL